MCELQSLQAYLCLYIYTWCTYITSLSVHIDWLVRFWTVQTGYGNGLRKRRRKQIYLLLSCPTTECRAQMDSGSLLSTSLNGWNDPSEDALLHVNLHAVRSRLQYSRDYFLASRRSWSVCSDHVRGSHAPCLPLLHCARLGKSWCQPLQNVNLRQHPFQFPSAWWVRQPLSLFLAMWYK